METSINFTTWLYVIVINPGQNEQLFGRIDSKNDVSYIPAFKNKNSAQKGINLVNKVETSKYEVQAIIYEDLLRYALAGGFLIFIIDDKGKITKCITP